jgi:sugar lactone lactonase YvrE
MNICNTARSLRRSLSILGAMLLLFVGCKGGGSGLSLSKLSTLSLLAGPPGGGPGHADGTGADARFNSPSWIAFDGDRNFFISDFSGDTIRKLDLATGEVTTLAGKPGQCGLAEGVGADAQFCGPSGLAFYDHHLYVADKNNQAIREVAVDTGMVTTVAGGARTGPDHADGTGEAAHFAFPEGLASDGTGALYVADTSSHTIRKLDLASREVITIAGTAFQSGNSNELGNVQFSFPYGLAVAGNTLFIADHGNSAIRALDLSSGAVSTLTVSDGNGASVGLRGPAGVAPDGDGNLFVADLDGHAIRRVDAATGAIMPLAGSSVGEDGISDGVGDAARFDFPRGLALDNQGDLFIVDGGNFEIRRLVIATREVVTVAGVAGPRGGNDGTGTTARFYFPSGLTNDGDGNLFVADTYNCSIRKVAIRSGEVTTLAGSARQCDYVDGTGTDARFILPSGVASDGRGHLFVGDTGNHTIREVVIATGAVTTVAGSADEAATRDGTASDARFTSPYGIAVDGQGNLFISDADAHTIRKMVLSSLEVTTLAGTAGEHGDADGIGPAARFYFPSGLVSDGQGNLFVADTLNDTIRKVVVATREVTTFAGAARQRGNENGFGPDARFYFPSGLASDGRGNLIVADASNHAIRKIVIATGEVSLFAGNFEIVRIRPGPLPAELAFPSALTVTPSGIALLDGHSVLLIH